MPQQTGLTLLEILITLFIFSAFILGLLADHHARHQCYRSSLERAAAGLRLENVHEYPNT